MSSAYAIAAVSTILQALLVTGLEQARSQSSSATFPFVPEDSVKGVPPDTLEDYTGLNCFLYQVTPNLGWRNEFQPTRNARAEKTNNQPLALDLHFLLSAHASGELVAETLLGAGMLALHTQAVLPRGMIRSILNDLTGDGLVQPLQESKLADQFELVKITPEYLNNDEMSKLWSAVQSSYRPSMSYLVTVVLIEPEESVLTPLPVLTPNIAVHPSLGPFTACLQIIQYLGEGVSAHFDEIITLKGINLEQTLTRVKLTHMQRGEIGEFAITAINNEEASLDLSGLGIDLPAGIYQLSYLSGPSEAQIIESNKLPLVISPRFTVLSAVNDGSVVRIELNNIAPVIQAEQEVLFILGQYQQAATVSTPSTAAAEFAPEDFPAPSQHLLRLRIDGTDSRLIDHSSEPPAFLAAARVDIT